MLLILIPCLHPSKAPTGRAHWRDQISLIFISQQRIRLCLTLTGSQLVRVWLSPWDCSLLLNTTYFHIWQGRPPLSSGSAEESRAFDLVRAGIEIAVPHQVDGAKSVIFCPNVSTALSIAERVSVSSKLSRVSKSVLRWRRHKRCQGSLNNRSTADLLDKVNSVSVWAIQ